MAKSKEEQDENRKDIRQHEQPEAVGLQRSREERNTANDTRSITTERGWRTLSEERFEKFPIR